MDTNGAGDTFATAYMLALARHARSPGADANWVASRAVMHEQACKPQCVLEGIVLGSSYAQYRQWLRGQVRLQSRGGRQGLAFLDRMPLHGNHLLPEYQNFWLDSLLGTQL